MIDEFNVSAVLDVGCGTGTFGSLLAQRGTRVLGVDPAGASAAVAHTKPSADQVTWIVGTALDVAADPAQQQQWDLATMTANVAQVFLSNEEWALTLQAIRACLRPGGYVAFKSRVPSDRGWTRWTKELTQRVVDVVGEGPVEEWVQVTKVDGAFVTFDSPTIFLADGERVDSTSTLRFRTEEEFRDSLSKAGFAQIQVRDLPYAPSRGWLIIAHA
ncbi:class I SAM-dependent methyltransferase [Arthrobacter sp. CAN_A212]|uniref:class I SAM-dependent methyltransferase n=1 Tax=Arthrobacter sp. CAN_A212 TaxID=2787719 RepID=UPI0018CB6911